MGLIAFTHDVIQFLKGRACGPNPEKRPTMKHLRIAHNSPLQRTAAAGANRSQELRRQRFATRLGRTFKDDRTLSPSLSLN
jgi:hypothetical protein